MKKTFWGHAGKIPLWEVFYLPYGTRPHFWTKLKKESNDNHRYRLYLSLLLAIIVLPLIIMFGTGAFPIPRDGRTFQDAFKLMVLALCIGLGSTIVLTALGLSNFFPFIWLNKIRRNHLALFSVIMLPTAFVIAIPCYTPLPFSLGFIIMPFAALRLTQNYLKHYEGREIQLKPSIVLGAALAIVLGAFGLVPVIMSTTFSVLVSMQILN